VFIVLDELIGHTVQEAWDLPYALHVVVLVFIAAWIALVLHELAHGLVALALGILAWSFEWLSASWRAPLISAADGIANLLAAAAVIAYRLGMPRLTPPSFALFSICLVVNLLMFLNLMPIRGLDGGRLVVRAADFRRQSLARG
jgi:hypothetical protein